MAANLSNRPASSPCTFAASTSSASARLRSPSAAARSASATRSTTDVTLNLVAEFFDPGPERRKDWIKVLAIMVPTPRGAPIQWFGHLSIARRGDHSARPGGFFVVDDPRIPWQAKPLDHGPKRSFGVVDHLLVHDRVDRHLEDRLCLIPHGESQVIELGNGVELKKIRHRAIEPEVGNEAAQNHIGRMPKRKNEACIGKQPKDLRHALKIERRLVDQHRAFTQGHVLGGELEITLLSAANCVVIKV